MYMLVGLNQLTELISRKLLIAVNVFHNDFYLFIGIQPLLQGRV